MKKIPSIKDSELSNCLEKLVLFIDRNFFVFDVLKNIDLFRLLL